MVLAGIVKTKKYLKSVNIESITIEQLAFYLPYEISVMRRYYESPSAEYFKEKLTGLTKEKVLLECEKEDYINIIPILRPMSDINSIIETDEGPKNFAGILDLSQDEDGDWCERVYADQCESPSVMSVITGFNWWLFKYHFDVFDLIEKGLAISIHDVKES